MIEAGHQVPAVRHAPHVVGGGTVPGWVVPHPSAEAPGAGGMTDRVHCGRSYSTTPADSGATGNTEQWGKTGDRVIP